MLSNVIQKIDRELTIEQVLSHFKASRSSDKTKYFCPLPRCVADRYPHFVIEDNVAIDQYDVPIDFEHHINKDIVVRRHWLCQHSHIEGFGTLSLLSAIKGYTTDLSLLSRNQWVSLINLAHDICGVPVTELADDARNGWLSVYQPMDQWQVRISDTFSPEAFRVLAIDGMDGIDTKSITDILHAEFGLWQIEKYITAGCYPSSRHKEDEFRSYERRSHALFPIFAFCYDSVTGLPLSDNPEKKQDPWVARIVMPGFVRRSGEDFDWKADFWTAFSTSDISGTVRKFKRDFPMFGDVITTEVSRIEEPIYDEEGNVVQSDDSSIGALRIVEKYSSKETLVNFKEVIKSVEKTDKNGYGTGKFEDQLVVVDLHSLEYKLNRCVLFKSPLDGVSAFMWLNYPRLRLPNGRHANNYWHVAWLAHDNMMLNPFENAMLRRVANETFELFGNDRSEVVMANNNALQYNYLRLCMFPTSMSEMDKVDWGIGVYHIPHTPIDFFRYYVPTMDELARNTFLVGSTTGCKSIMLQRELVGSSALKPFTNIPKKKKRPGEKPYTYEINMAATWQLMRNMGYCRSLMPNKKRDTIGQCYHIDGRFVYELDPDSVMADMRCMLENYAKDNASDPEDAEMMLNAILRCKDLQYNKNITKLPLMAMPKSESYNSELDYFFFRNCALEITPRSITPRSYDELDFLVYRSQVLPFDYRQPFFGNHSPISIRQSDEYTSLEKQYENLRKSGNASDDELFDMRQRLRDKSMVGRWDISIKPTEKEIDPRIVVPKFIIEDNKHNEWLRWWPFLRLLRCFANENFQEEEQGHFVDGDRTALMARMANLMFTLGRCIFRYRGVQYMPYFLENTVDREGKAQGGSGKSVLIEHFVKFVRYVCNVNGKDIKDTGDFAKNFSNYVQHKHDVVHIEDFPKMAIDPLFNYASGTFRARSLFENPVEIDHSESPNIVITSNFMVQSTDESSLGRVQFGGMSHYFSREVAVMNKEGRKLDTIMPDIHINGSAADYSIEQRSQIIYVLAKCLQFTMMCTAMSVQVPVPGTDLLERLSRTEMGDTFYDWFTNFLQQPWVYNSPIAINEIFNDYRRYLDPSKARIEMVSRTKFYENLQKYCAKPAHGVLFMPIKPFLSVSELNRSKKKVEDGSEKSYLRKGSSWFTRSFVDDKGKVHYARVLEKNAGEGSVTGGAVWFSIRGKEPKSPEEFQQMLDSFAMSPDPSPILDENEQPVTESIYSAWTMLNTEEEAEIIRKSGGIRRQSAFPSPASVSTPGTTSTSPTISGEAEPDSLPF